MYACPLVLAQVGTYPARVTVRGQRRHQADLCGRCSEDALLTPDSEILIPSMTGDRKTSSLVGSELFLP